MIRVVALGGALGSALRWAISLLWPSHFPWTTLAINIIGSAALGALLAWISLRPQTHPLLRPFVGTGILGGFTTFSTFTVEARALPAGLAATYVVLTVTGAVTAVVFADRLVRRWQPSP
ncbi:CrcB protein [Allocatelliglobosispora scoriae]|uniref:Fluoride-specific ion channel FluC n=1 Tax=Allocatelliglobosispora scoriae TaxID=643052 RepID=A0A841BRV5_9ACTN|nr:CrcB family protein [Allocatelliglobosispora scoriae]MBB5870974.1 CrcB protein [Allocatelliglobosispora scoriae]